MFTVKLSKYLTMDRSRQKYYPVTFTYLKVKCIFVGMINGKIIVVDDNEAVLKTLRVILSREFKMVVCASVPTLLPALLRDNDVDVVLLDMNFGTGKQNGGEGLFWLDRIREHPEPPEVVLITAFR